MTLISPSTAQWPQSSQAGIAPAGYYPFTFPNENRFLWSEDFSNAYWNKLNSTVGATTTAPDGTNTAQKIQETAVFAAHGIVRNYSGLTPEDIALSCFAKAVERSWIVVFAIVGGIERLAWFNVSTGAQGVVDAGIAASVEASPNGFYRCALFAPASLGALTQVRFCTSPGGNGVHPFAAGTLNSGLYLWGANLNGGQFLSPYRKTTTAAVSSPGVLGFTADPDESNAVLTTNDDGQLQVSDDLAEPAAEMSVLGGRVLFTSIPAIP